MEPPFKLEDLGFKGRLRILETIYQHGPINISAVGRRCGINYANVDNHVRGLVKMGLVEEKRYGHMHIRMLRPGYEQIHILIKHGMKIKIEAQKVEPPR